MKLNIFRQFDIDAMREANPNLKIVCRGQTITITPKYMACPDCGEPMANGGECGYYCIAKGCYHDRFPRRKKVSAP